MSDLTPVLSTLLVDFHSSSSLLGVSGVSQKLDLFLREAYTINTGIISLLSELRQIRQPYLSTAPPPRRTTGKSQVVYLTDSQREEIDASTSDALRQLNGRISSLNTAAQKRATADATLLEKKYGKPNGVLWKWAAGQGDAPDDGKTQEQLEDEGRMDTAKMFREGVLWYLGAGLSRAASIQQEMVEIRLSREREKERSILYKTKASRLPTHVEGLDGQNGSTYGEVDTWRSSYNPAVEQERNRSIESQLSPEQLQLFKSENSSLLNHYNDTLTKVTQAEKSLLEIASLQQTLLGHLSIQGEMIEQLVEDAQSTDENVRRGNQQLKKASERSSTARGVFWATVGLCGFLVGWDLVF